MPTGTISRICCKLTARLLPAIVVPALATMSSRRRPGSITTGLSCWKGKALTSAVHNTRRGVWVLAFAGKTLWLRQSNATGKSLPIIGIYVKSRNRKYFAFTEM